MQCYHLPYVHILKIELSLQFANRKFYLSIFNFHRQTHPSHKVLRNALDIGFKSTHNISAQDRQVFVGESKSMCSNGYLSKSCLLVKLAKRHFASHWAGKVVYGMMAPRKNEANVRSFIMAFTKAF